MPSKHAVKTFIEDGYYHTYNRGVEKSNVFRDDQDYRVFLHLLKFYLSPSLATQEHPLTSLTGFQPVRPRPFQSLHDELKLLAYCLMPNHFHLLLQQRSRDGMTRFHRQLCTNYSMYFNRKYNRVGHLFQGIYKASLIKEDAYLLHVSRYIHLNPSQLVKRRNTSLAYYPYSSYAYYLRKKRADWVDPSPILTHFQGARDNLPRAITSYEAFVEDYDEDSRKVLIELALD